MNIRETRIYYEIHTFTQKTKKMSHYLRVLLCVPIGALIIVSLGCGGCGGVKDAGKEKKVDISPKDRIDTSNATMAVVKIDTSTFIRTEFPELITFKYYDQQNYQFEQYDEYNYVRKILVFKDSKTKNVIKEIDIVKENPFHSQGFKRRIEPGKENFYYFLMKKGTESKFELRDYLPEEVFNEIPNDYPFYRAMASISAQNIGDNYATIIYCIEWLPDAYSDNGEWEGPGYGVHYVDVYDSLGIKIFSRKYSGTSNNASISADGRYVFNMSCLTLERDKNIRYHFTVYKVSDGSLVYEETFQNCQHDSGKGTQTIYIEYSNGYGVSMSNETFKEFRYSNGKFYTKYGKNENIDSYELLPKEKMKVNFTDGTSKIISFDNYYEILNLK